MKEELLQFKLQQVWTLVDLPNGKRAIGTKWVYRNKKDERGIVIKNKARLVTQGYTQEEGVDYDEVLAHVARIEVIRLFLAYALFKDFVVYKMDVKSAFLYGNIEEEFYVCQPPGFDDPDFLDRVYKVEKALYGLHQAPKAWYDTLLTYLLDNGFQRGKIDKTLFIRRDTCDILSMGELIFFLGLLVKQKEDGIFIRQDKYVTEILKKFSFSDVKTTSTPIETHKHLLKDTYGEDVDKDLYRSMIGLLMYLILQGLILRQPKLGLWYPKDSPFDLVAYTDSDYAGSSLDRKSTTRSCQFLGCRFISWHCKKQTVVPNSTTEVEYIAASNCCGQVLWIQNQLPDYGYNYMQTKIHIDNEGTMYIVKNPVFHSKTKHIEIRHHFIRDSNEKKLIQMIKIHTDHNVLDLLKKAFDVRRFEYLITSIRMLNLLMRKRIERYHVIRNKDRLVAQGYTQEEGIDYDEMDVKSTFLYGKIEEEVYVYQPPGFEDPEFPDIVYKVEKALYGLHQAPRAWYKTLSTYLLDNGFQRGTIDKTLFIKKIKGDILLVQVYVDDIIFGSTKKNLCTKFEKLMHKKFQMSSMGELTLFLGLQVTQKNDGIFISQDKYVDEILKKFGFSTVKTASTLIETSKPLMKDENAEDVDVYLYRSMIGSLMYLTSSRHDIMFVVCACARFQDSPFDLEAYTDSDYAGASLDRKSTTGGCQFLGSRLISWQYKKQTVVANSTTEAKLLTTARLQLELQLRRVFFDYKTKTSCIEHADFDEIVDFLNASPIRYALTVSPTIYVSYIELFWSTAKIKIVNNERQIHAKVVGKTIVISESSVRRDLQFNDEDVIAFLNDKYDTPSHTKKVFAKIRRQGKDFSGIVTPLFAAMLIQPQAVEGEGSGQPTEPQHTPTTASPSNIEPIPVIASSSHPKKTHKRRKTKRIATTISRSSRPTTLVADETVHEERGESMERAAITTASLDAEQDSGSGPKRQDTILGDRHAQTRFERLSKQSNDLPISRVNTPGSGEDRLKIMELMEICTKLSDMFLALENVKTAQDFEITIRIESSTNKSLGDQEDASKQGRNEEDEDISWLQEDAKTQGRYDQDIDVTTTSALITTIGVFVSTAKPSTPPTTTTLIKDEDLTIAQTLMKMRSEKSKEKAKERGSKEKSSDPTTRPTKGVTMQEPSQSGTRKAVPPSQHDLKDKGKAKMIEPEKPLKKKDHIKFDEEVAKRLTEELEAELEEEERIARQKEDETNLISWDNTQAVMEVDYELAQRLQAEEQGELTIEERSRLFVELMDKRKNHFAKLIAKNIRRKPPTKAQKRD
ncbi:putative ribonuclease H-like domain-containing protein [Tanacetum coccineum]